MPSNVLRATSLCTHVVLAENASGCKQKRELACRLLFGWNVWSWSELAKSAHKLFFVHDWRAVWVGVVAWPLNTAFFVEASKRNTLKRWGECCNFVHDFAGLVVAHWVTKCVRKFAHNFPFVLAGLWAHGRANAVNASLCVGERSVFFEERSAREEHVCETRGLV